MRNACGGATASRAAEAGGILLLDSTIFVYISHGGSYELRPLLVARFGSHRLEPTWKSCNNTGQPSCAAFGCSKAHQFLATSCHAWRCGHKKIVRQPRPGALLRYSFVSITSPAITFPKLCTAISLETCDHNQCCKRGAHTRTVSQVIHKAPHEQSCIPAPKG